MLWFSSCDPNNKGLLINLQIIKRIRFCDCEKPYVCSIEIDNYSFSDYQTKGNFYADVAAIKALLSIY